MTTGNTPVPSPPADNPSDVPDLAVTLRLRERQIEAIRRVSEALFTHPTVGAMVEQTLRIALDVLRADAGTVYLYDPTDDTLVFRYVIGGSGDALLGTRIASDKGIAGAVFGSRTSRLDGSVQIAATYNRDVDERYGYHTESMMTVAMKHADAVPVGVMQVLNARFPPFTPFDLEVLEVLCSQAATGIEYFRMTEKAKKAEVVNVIGDISHDIKNMLTPIQSGVMTLEPMLDTLFADLDAIRARYGDAGELAEDIRRVANSVRDDYGWMLQNALHAAEQVQARTKEIADTVKGEMTPPFFERASVNETCEQVALTLKIVAAKAQVALVLDLHPVPEAEFDRKQLYNAVYNLVNNALPETPEGGSVTIRTRQQDADTLRIEIADTGRGMPPHVKARLFTDQAVSTKPGGTGLGTRIVMGVVRRHHGTITVNSEIGVGTTFTVLLPIVHDVG